MVVLAGLKGSGIYGGRTKSVDGGKSSDEETKSDEEKGVRYASKYSVRHMEHVDWMQKSWTNRA